MTLLSAAVNALPADIELFADKVFSIAAFICLPILAFTLILLVLLMASFLVSVTFSLSREVYNNTFKRRLESKGDKK